ncbi:unnamed protein product [Paramecium octaurelia]|uniref:Uncharacterized protein n=1 Tax=Paramecium octaurelia TaxID=43137 RepID=A0A8S1XFU8_PAROT|nr:unnamed protein product [Paramecium octaurelia]CAD8199957.1 unnamed protein product [Paramecium octaurelia]
MEQWKSVEHQIIFINLGFNIINKIMLCSKTGPLKVNQYRTSLEEICEPFQRIIVKNALITSSLGQFRAIGQISMKI